MACSNCNNASKTCDPCAFCTPPGVTNLPSCGQPSPCGSDGIDIKCVTYAGIDFNCDDISITNGDSVFSVLIKMLDVLYQSAECCLLTGSAHFITTTTTSTTTTTTSTTTTTTTIPPCKCLIFLNNSTSSQTYSYINCLGQPAGGTISGKIGDIPGYVKVCGSHPSSSNLVTVQQPNVNCIDDVCPITTTTTSTTTTTTTTIDCGNRGGTLIEVPYVEFSAVNVTKISLHGIDSNGTFYINYGDGTRTEYTAGSYRNNLIHDYSSPYTGKIRIEAANLANIINFYDADYGGVDTTHQGFECTSGGSVTIDTSEIAKLKGLIEIELLNFKTTGNVISLQGATSIRRFVAWGNGRPGSADCKNTIFGNIADLPKNLYGIGITGNNTITGDIKNSPRGTLSPSNEFSLSIGGLNTLYGDIKDLPTSSVSGARFGVEILGNNVITGDIATIPRVYKYISFGGGSEKDHTPSSAGNTIYGNIANLPSDLEQLWITGDNTLTGNLNTLPSTLIYLYIRGMSTITGTIQSMPCAPNLKGLWLLDDTGITSVTGSLTSIMNTSLFPQLEGIEVRGNQVITGAISSINNNIINFTVFSASSNLTGSLSDLTSKTNLKRFVHKSDISVISGNLSQLPPDMIAFSLISPHSTITSSYTSHTWPSNMCFIDIENMTFSTIDINNLLVDLSNTTWSGCDVAPYIILKGTPTGAGLGAKNTLISNGVSVTITP